jgi:hypothetical protein
MDETRDSERREGTRVKTLLPVHFEWETPEGELRRTRGTTRDVSPKGIFSFVEDALSPREALCFEMLFPADLTGGSPMRVRCEGHVVRLETLGRRYGIGVTIEQHEISETFETSDDSDRRTNIRLRPRSSVMVEYPGLTSAIRDLSHTGAFIEDERPLPVGRVVTVRLRSEGLQGEIEAKAIVRRVEPQIGMAVEFVAIRKESNQRLQHFLASHTARPSLPRRRSMLTPDYTAAISVDGGEESATHLRKLHL